MGAQHTPGPWCIVPYGDGDSLVIHDARGDWRVCFMATPGTSSDGMRQIEANARLIAAAPQLLDALKTLAEVATSAGQHHLYYAPSRDFVAAIDAARAAIAAATSNPQEK